MDDFEQRLQRQPLNAPPASWRDAILGEARRKMSPEREPRPALLARFREWLWPHPAAWAGLATIWLVLFLVQHQMNVEIRDEIELAGTRAPVRDVLLAFEEQQALINQLLAANDTLDLPAMDRPRRPARTQPLHPLMLIAS